MILFLVALIIILVFGFVVFFGAPYVPSKTNDTAGALDTLYGLGKKDVLVDIGSGDGKVLRMASARGARAIGYELNPVLVLLTWFLSRRDSKVKVHLANAWHADLPKETTVVYVFMVERDAKRFTKQMQTQADKIGRAIYVISYGSQLTLEPYRKHRAHFLYKIEPLQPMKAQV